MNQIQRNAIAYKHLLDIEYYFCLAAKGKGYEVRLRFKKDDFHHLEGFGQLRDISIHQESGNKSFEMALTGTITEEFLKTSELFGSNKIQNKIDYLYLLETALDHNDMVFRCIKDQTGRIKIEAKFLLFTDLSGNMIYIYVDKADNSNSDYFCRSFVANPDFDRTKGQTKMTLLWKEKRELSTGKHYLQYQLNDFTPDKLKK